MKKLAFVTNIIPHYRETFYKKLMKKYVYILISSRHNTNDGRPALDRNILDNHIIVNDGGLSILGIDFIYQKGAANYVKKFNPDIIIILGLSRFITNWILLFWGKLNKKKLVIWSSGWERIEKNNLLYKIKRLINFFYYNLADYVLVYSTKGKEYLQPLLLNKNKIGVCLNGIEIDHLVKNENEIKSKSSILKEEYPGFKIFLYVGGMLREKNVDLLINAFKELNKKYRNIILWLVGDGPDIGYFESCAKENEKIIFFGRKVDNVDEYFAACDYFVLPGLGGLALNQAMFWGKPCIVSEADGTEDDLVVNGETGYRFIKNNPDSLLKVMENSLLTDDSIYESMSKKCSDIIREISNVDNMVDTFFKIL